MAMDFMSVASRAARPTPPQPAGIIASEETPAPVETRRDPFDLAAAALRLQTFEAEITRMVEWAEGLVVKTDDDAVAATEAGAKLVKLAKRLDEARKKALEPHKAFTDGLNGICKGWSARIEQIKKALSAKLLPYQQRKAEEERHRQESARKAEAEARRKAEEEAKALGVEAVEVAATVHAPAPTEKVKTALGTAYTVELDKFEIVDAQAVPRQYMMVDERLIREAIKGGIREIPGVRIWTEKETRFRN